MMNVLMLLLCYYSCLWVAPLSLLEGPVIFTATLELGILIVFNKYQTQGVYQRAYGAKAEVDGMSRYEYKKHDDDAQEDVHARRHVYRQRVKDTAQDRPGESDSEETNIRERISQQP